jgi:flagellar protein FlaJ
MANLKIAYRVYLSVVAFVLLVTVAVSASAITALTLLGIQSLLLFAGLATLPVLVLVVAGIVPDVVLSNRTSALKTEIPYASMYISVMASGGLSPYRSFMRLRESRLLPRLSAEVKRIQGMVFSRGVDPVSAMEQSARIVAIREYKELLFGYASTLRSGGDALHYLVQQTEAMFKGLASKIKVMGETLSLLMESYTIVGILGTLGVYMFFVISLSVGSGTGLNLSPDTFFLFSFVALPVISIVFLYLGDMVQIGYPTANAQKIRIVVATIPFGVALVTQLAVPFFVPDFPHLPPLRQLVADARAVLGFEEGCEAALGLAIALTVASIPITVHDFYDSNREKGVFGGITSFLRDLVETRKTGLDPEKCIKTLARRDYGFFSKHLKLISLKINIGVPMRQVFEEFSGKVTNWLSQIYIHLLIDTLEVGGGNEDSLETLAEFAESTRLLEKERQGLIRPLVLVPYIGAALLTATVIMFIQFSTGLTTTGVMPVSAAELCRILLTPLIFHSYMLGLVAGKIASGRVLSGLKHGMFLVIISIIGIRFAAYMPALFTPAVV